MDKEREKLRKVKIEETMMKEMKDAEEDMKEEAARKKEAAMAKRLAEIEEGEKAQDGGIAETGYAFCLLTLSLSLSLSLSACFSLCRREKRAHVAGEWIV